MTKRDARTSSMNGKSLDRSSRQSRASALVSFVDEHSLDEIQNGQYEDKEDEGDDMLNIIQGLQKRKAKSPPASANAFQNQKEAVYVEARRDALYATRDGIEYLDQALDKFSHLINQEGFYQKYLQDFLPLYNTNDESVQSLLSLYPTLLQDLVPRRTEDIDAASTMLMSFPKNREASRKRLMRNARNQINEGLENQRVATDAAALIKHYKALLLS